MKSSILKSGILALFAIFMAPICSAATVTVGPSGTYATPCAAFSHLADGDTLQIDANGGVPYAGHDCTITKNNLTIVGVNGRPIMDSTGVYVGKAIWVLNGHDITIDNVEFRNSHGGSGGCGNAEALRIQAGTTAAPNGGNITLQRSYIHDTDTGILGNGVGINTPTHAWYSSSPFITLQYDEIYHNGCGDGQSHNMYFGDGGNLNFTLQYSWSHDSNQGHEVKTRAPINNVLYNLITDSLGTSDYLLDFSQGGRTYVVGNSVYKGPACSDCNQAVAMWRNNKDIGGDAAYGTPYEDFHFINNTVVDDPANGFPGHYVSLECFTGDSAACALPAAGGPLTVNAVFQNNVFLGPVGFTVTNQSTALVQNNLLYDNTTSNMALMDFNNPSAFDYRIKSGSPAIGAGLYPPTDNTSTADPMALAVYEYVNPANKATRPTPTGSTMDAGAFHYSGTITPPSLGLTYTTSVTTPNSGTITVTGLPTPAAGQYNYAVLMSQNLSAIPKIPSVASSTGTITTTFNTTPIAATTVVPIYIYVDGTVLTANVTVVPGPPVPYSLKLPSKYYPGTLLTLKGPAPAGGTVATLSSSDSTILWAPATVTVPAGQVSVPIGTLDGSLWAPAISAKGPVTLTATAGGTTVTLTTNIYSPTIHSFGCNGSECTITGGQPFIVELEWAGISPYGGSTLYITSNNTAVIPNQTWNWPQGTQDPPNQEITLQSNSVTTSTPVVLTATYDGSVFYIKANLTVNPGSGSSTITASSGSGQTAAVGSNFPNPLVALVKDGSGNPQSGVVVTFAGTNVSFPSGATATTNSSGLASVTAQPSATGSLTVTATAPGATGTASFAETGTPAGPTIASITKPSQYNSAVTVTLTAAATSPVVVNLSSSDTSVWWTPPTLTIPTGATSASDPALAGSLWLPVNQRRPFTVTATANGSTQTLSGLAEDPFIHAWGSCGTCTVQGGQTKSVSFQLNVYSPYGGSTFYVTSDNPAIVPNQSFVIPQGTYIASPVIQTNAVSTSTVVTLTGTYNGAAYYYHPKFTVTP